MWKRPALDHERVPAGRAPLGGPAAARELGGAAAPAPPPDSSPHCSAAGAATSVRSPLVRSYLISSPSLQGDGVVTFAAAGSACPARAASTARAGSRYPLPSRTASAG